MITADWASKEDIDKVFFDPELYDRQSEDHYPPPEKFPMRYYGHWIGGYVDGEIASLFWVPKGDEFHFMVLKKYRMNARNLYYESREMWPHYIKCEIPKIFPSVINFAKNVGFTEIGKKEKVWKKYGQLHDLIILESNA